MEVFSCFDDDYPASVIPAGDYILRVGVSSRDTKIEAVLTVPELVVREKYVRILEDDARYHFEDLKNPGTGKQAHQAIDEAQLAACERRLTLNLSRVRRSIIRYRGVSETHLDERKGEVLTLGSVVGRNAGVAEFVAQFSVEELAEAWKTRSSALRCMFRALLQRRLRHLKEREDSPSWFWLTALQA